MGRCKRQNKHSHQNSNHKEIQRGQDETIHSKMSERTPVDQQEIRPKEGPIHKRSSTRDLTNRYRGGLSSHRSLRNRDDLAHYKSEKEKHRIQHAMMKVYGTSYIYIRYDESLLYILHLQML